jgi:hypothetical protein
MGLEKRDHTPMRAIMTCDADATALVMGDVEIVSGPGAKPLARKPGA